MALLVTPFASFVAVAGATRGAVAPSAAAGNPGDLLTSYGPDDYWTYEVIEDNLTAAPWTTWLDFFEQSPRVGLKLLFEVFDVNASNHFDAYGPLSAGDYDVVWGWIYATDENGTWRAAAMGSSKFEFGLNFSDPSYEYSPEPFPLSVANDTFALMPFPYAFFAGAGADWEGGLFDASFLPLFEENGLDVTVVENDDPDGPWAMAINSTDPNDYVLLNMTSDGRALKSFKHVRDGFVVAHVDLVESGPATHGWGVHTGDGDMLDLKVEYVHPTLPTLSDFKPQMVGDVLRYVFKQQVELREKELGLWMRGVEAERAAWNHVDQVWETTWGCPGPAPPPDKGEGHLLPTFFAVSYAAGYYRTDDFSVLAVTSDSGVDMAKTNQSVAYMIETNKNVYYGLEGGPEFDVFDYDQTTRTLNFTNTAWDVYVSISYDTDGFAVAMEERNASSDQLLVRLTRDLLVKGKMHWGLNPGDRILAHVDTFDPANEYVFPAEEVEGLAEHSIIDIQITDKKSGCAKVRPWDPWAEEMFFDEFLEATVKIANETDDYGTWTTVMDHEFWFGFRQVNDSFEINGPGPAAVPVLEPGLATEWMDDMLNRVLLNRRTTWTNFRPVHVDRRRGGLVHEQLKQRLLSHQGQRHERPVGERGHRQSRRPRLLQRHAGVLPACATRGRRR